MKEKIHKVLVVLIFLIGFLIFALIPIAVMVVLGLITGQSFVITAAEDNPYGTPIRIESTAYCYGEITASGHEVREGIAAGRREWIGLTAVVYADDAGEVGELIGIYEILDTGGDERIRNGECIDIYIPDRAAAKEYGRKDVWVQIVNAKG